LIKRFREWGPSTNEAKNPGNNPTNAATAAKDKKFQEKMKKAIAGKYCVKCEKKECYVKRLAECQEKSIQMGKTKCSNFPNKKTKANVNNIEDGDDEEEVDDTMDINTTAISFTPGQRQITSPNSGYQLKTPIIRSHSLVILILMKKMTLMMKMRQPKLTDLQEKKLGIG
jgi:hypothetical protein